jgi:hypothetical protein
MEKRTPTKSIGVAEIRTSAQAAVNLKKKVAQCQNKEKTALCSNKKGEIRRSRLSLKSNKDFGESEGLPWKAQ